MAVSVAGAKSLQKVWEWVCDALLRSDILLVPLSVWCSSVNRTHAQPWEKCHTSPFLLVFFPAFWSVVGTHLCLRGPFEIHQYIGEKSVSQLVVIAIRKVFNGCSRCAKADGIAVEDRARGWIPKKHRTM